MGWGCLGWPRVSSEEVISIRSPLASLEAKVTESLLGNIGKEFCALLLFLEIQSLASSIGIEATTLWWHLVIFFTKHRHEVQGWRQTPGLDSQLGCQPSYLTYIPSVTSPLPNISRRPMVFHPWMILYIPVFWCNALAPYSTWWTRKMTACPLPTSLMVSELQKYLWVRYWCSRKGLFPLSLHLINRTGCTAPHQDILSPDNPGRNAQWIRNTFTYPPHSQGYLFLL